MTTEAATGLLQFLRPKKSYWDCLPPEIKDECVDRNVWRQLCHLKAFNAKGPVQDKWNDDIYPKIRSILQEGKAEIFRQVKTQIPYVFHLFMVEEGRGIWPSFVAICYNMAVGQKITKLVRRRLRTHDFGLKYFAFKSLLAPTGSNDEQHTSEKINVCGAELILTREDSKSNSNVYCTLGGGIILGNQVYGLTVAHVLGQHTEDDLKNTTEPEALWAAEFDEDTDSEGSDHSEEHNLDQVKVFTQLPQVQLLEDLSPWKTSIIAGDKSCEGSLTDTYITSGGQLSLRDDWLLVPMGVFGRSFTNKFSVGSEVRDVNGFQAGPVHDQMIILCLASSAPKPAELSTTLAGLYMPSAADVLSVFSCNKATSR